LQYSALFKNHSLDTGAQQCLLLTYKPPAA
jgi:hypothetical protein